MNGGGRDFVLWGMLLGEMDGYEVWVELELELG